jgi:KAP family P-loop domain
MESAKHRDSRSSNYGSSDTIRTAKLRAWLVAAAASGLATLTYWGVIFDTSVRPDPFSRTPNLWDRIAYPLPHPALSEMPVIPIGAKGNFTWRPMDTTWVNWPFEGDVKLETVETPVQQNSSASKFFVSGAFAQTSQGFGNPSNSASPNSDANTNISGDRLAVPPLKGWTGNRILYASCTRNGLNCLVASDEGIQSKTLINGKWITEKVGVGLKGSEPWTPLYVNISQDANFGTGISMGNVQTATSNKPFGPERWNAKAGSDKLIRNKGSSVWINNTFNTEERLAANSNGWGAGAFMSSDGIWATAEGDGATDGETFLEIDGEKLDFKSIQKNINAYYKPDSFNLYVGDGGTLIRSEGDGIGEHLGNGLGSSNYRSIVFLDDEKTGWVASGWGEDSDSADKVGGLSRPSILMTLDAGLTWERLPYRLHAAPWVPFGALPLTLMAFCGLFFAYRAIPKTADPSIVGRAASDRPIGLDDPDALRLNQLALALERFLRNTGTEPPLTVAVEGKWGTGKSSLMNLLRQRLASRGERSVWFNAWHNQNEEQLFAALFEKIRTQATPPSWQYSGILFHLRLLWIRFSRHVWGIVVLLTFFFLFWKIFHDWLPFGYWQKMLDAFPKDWDWLTVEKPSWKDFLLRVAATLGTAGIAIAAIFKLVTPFSTLTASPLGLLNFISIKARVADYSEKLSFQFRFSREFSDVCDALQSPSTAGLVIFIDDLDRCNQEQVMRVLEAVNFLATAGKCFIVLGIDREQVKVRVNEAAKESKDSPYADKYLEKLFNMTVRVPEATPELTLSLATGRTEDDGHAERRGWRRVFRNAARALPEVAFLPALALAIALFVTNISLPPTPVSETREATKLANDTTQIPGSTPVGSEGNVLPETATANSEQTLETMLPSMDPTNLKDSLPLIPWTFPGLAALVMGLFALRGLSQNGEALIEDSAGFVKASEICHAAVFTKDPSPRAIKKHQNRLRFQAMRVRPVRPSRSLVERLFGTSENIQTSHSLPIRDESIVALGMVDYWCDGLPRQPWAELTRNTPEPLQGAMRHFTGGSAPTDDEIAIYLGMTKGTEEKATRAT